MRENCYRLFGWDGLPIGGGKDACLRHGVRKGLDGAGASVDADGGKKLLLGGFLVYFHQFEDGLGAVVVRRIIHRAVQLFQFRGKRLVIQFAGCLLYTSRCV